MNTSKAVALILHEIINNRPTMESEEKGEKNTFKLNVSMKNRFGGTFFVCAVESTLKCHGCPVGIMECGLSMRMLAADIVTGYLRE
jgi:hypothetical protein